MADVYAATVADTRDVCHRGGCDGGALRGGDSMSHEQPSGHEQPSEEGLRAQLEEELRRITVRDVLLQTVVSLVNLGGQRLGLAPGAEDARDLDGAPCDRGCAPCCPWSRSRTPSRCARSATRLSQLQLAYAQLAGGPDGRRPGAAGRSDPSRSLPAPAKAGPAPAPAGCGCLRAAAADRDQRVRRRAGIGTDRYTAAAFGGSSAPSAASLPPASRFALCGNLKRHDGGHGN